MSKMLKVTAIAALAGLTLAGCSSSGRGGDSSDGSGDGAGFAADATIGVALPDKTSENWVLAGDLFTNGLEDAGFTADVQYAGSSTPVPDQQGQIEAMITSGAEVIIVGAADTSQLSTQIQEAHDAGITVIAYDRLIQNTDALDYYLAFDNYHVGELQAQSLLDGLAERYPDLDSYNIELFSGSSDDSNSVPFFEGAMSVLQPKIDDGTLNVLSGQTEIGQTATEDWAAENAQARMDTILQGSYQGQDLHGVLSPNDTLARAIITSVEDDGRDDPIVTGQDSEEESVRSIMEGKQYSTIYKDTRELVNAAIEMASALQAGEEPAADETENNGAADIATEYLDPVIVTKDNAAEVYANDPDLLAIVEETN